MIDANVYPTGDKYNKGVRYNVDIKAIIPSIIREIRNVMTSDEYSLKYESSDFNTYLI